MLTTTNQGLIQQPLCNWSEIPSHPGLVMSMSLLSNNPVILMLLPDKIYYQEIKLVNNQGAPSKAKIQDMVAIRHPSGTSSGDEIEDTAMVESNNADEACEEYGQNEKTTMILLCDDGSLKIYVADQEKTEFWLQPHLRPMNCLMQQPHTGKTSSMASAAWISSGLLWNLLPSTIMEVNKAANKTTNLTDNQTSINYSLKYHLYNVRLCKYVN